MAKRPSAVKSMPAGAVEAEMPDTLKPMLAMLASHVFSDPEWLYEVKWDGVRALCFIQGDSVKILSRNLRDITASYPELKSALPDALRGHERAIIDGEIVAFEGERPSFEKLQRRMHVTDGRKVGRLAAEVPVVLCAFDILYLDGFMLAGCTLAERRTLLEDTVSPNKHVHVPAAYEGIGEKFYEAAVKQRLEGIVAKRKSSVYSAGSRSTDWLKFKAMRTLEAVIGGYTEPRGARKHFGALLLGLYKNGSLVYVGHTGTGFDEPLLAAMHEMMKAREIETCPFAGCPRTNTPAHWIRPELVAEVKYAEMTSDMKLRHPVFIGLRDDKPPLECTFEQELAELPMRAMQAEAEAERPARRRRVRLTKADKILWPKHGQNPPVTKKMLAEYFEEMADYIMPFVKYRPLMLNRYPDGVTGMAFFQKDYPDPVPDGVDVYVHHSRHAERDVRHIVCNNQETLTWLAQLACVELNCWLSRVDRPAFPDFLVFDIDPYITFKGRHKDPVLSEKDFAASVEAAKLLKSVLDALCLTGFLKTSGQTGLHVYIPIERQYGFNQTNRYARTLARHLENIRPDLITTTWTETERAGKVFLDYSINSLGKTLCAPYSLRPTLPATVSAPITWQELDDVHPQEFTFFTMQSRLAKSGDVWSGIHTTRNRLTP